MLRLLVLPLTCLALAACSGGNPQGIRPAESAGSRADGFVAMASTTTIGNPVGPDWQTAAGEAGRRCRGWGYDGAGSHTGWREVCRAWDRYGRCVVTVTTRYYPCTG